MDSLTTIQNFKSEIDAKKELLKTYREKFADTQLLKPNGTEVVSAQDPLHVTAYQVHRSDLLSLVAKLSDDILVDAQGHLSLVGISLKTFLENLIGDAADNANHPFNAEKEGNHGRSVWIDFAYGESSPRTFQNERIKNRKELQLVFTGVIDGKHPADDNVGVVCATTALTKSGTRPTEPPFSTPVHPMD